MITPPKKFNKSQFKRIFASFDKAMDNAFAERSEEQYTTSTKTAVSESYLTINFGKPRIKTCTRADKKAAAQKTSWSHVTCLKVTGIIANTVKSTGRGKKTLVVQ